jgi:membrane protein DedA with SNARE-associated domain
MEQTDVILNSIGGLSYGGIFVVALMSNLIIPVPEEIILLAIGYLTGIGVFMYPTAMGIFILGMLISDYVLYSLSYTGSRFVTRLKERLQKKGYFKNESYIKRNIHKIVFFSRFLVYLRFIGPVVSGSLKIKRKVFLTYDFLALVIYVNLFMWLGNFFHKQIFFIENGIAKFIHYFLTAIIVIAVIGALYYIQKNFIKWMNHLGDLISTIIPGLDNED